MSDLPEFGSFSKTLHWSLLVLIYMQLWNSYNQSIDLSRLIRCPIRISLCTSPLTFDVWLLIKAWNKSATIPYFLHSFLNLSGTFHIKLVYSFLLRIVKNSWICCRQDVLFNCYSETEWCISGIFLNICFETNLTTWLKNIIQGPFFFFPYVKQDSKSKVTVALKFSQSFAYS